MINPHISPALTHLYLYRVILFHRQTSNFGAPARRPRRQHTQIDILSFSSLWNGRAVGGKEVLPAVSRTMNSFSPSSTWGFIDDSRGVPNPCLIN